MEQAWTFLLGQVPTWFIEKSKFHTVFQVLANSLVKNLKKILSDWSGPFLLAAVNCHLLGIKNKLCRVKEFIIAISEWFLGKLPLSTHRIGWLSSFREHQYSLQTSRVEWRYFKQWYNSPYHRYLWLEIFIQWHTRSPAGDKANWVSKSIHPNFSDTYLNETYKILLDHILHWLKEVNDNKRYV